MMMQIFVLYNKSDAWGMNIENHYRLTVRLWLKQLWSNKGFLIVNTFVHTLVSLLINVIGALTRKESKLDSIDRLVT